MLPGTNLPGAVLPGAMLSGANLHRLKILNLSRALSPSLHRDESSLLRSRERPW